MDPLLGLPYVVHVLSALFWVGAVLYVAYALVTVPDDAVDATGVGLALDKLLRGTRWTGVALPVTGLYQVWALYPVDRLVGMTRGHLVVGMFLLWGCRWGRTRQRASVRTAGSPPAAHARRCRPSGPTSWWRRA